MTLAKTINDQLTELKFHSSVLAARGIKKRLVDARPELLLKFSRKKRDEITGDFARCSDVQTCIDFTKQYMGTGSCQITSEITGALDYIAASKPKVMCEIGTLNGGTSLLFGKFVPSIETMLCIDLHVKNKGILKLLAAPGQQWQFLDMPSYADETVSRVARFLDGRLFDAIFIDGDHRYEGVKQDFLQYRHFVREGGLILFHDIVATTGASSAWAGGVPQLWRELAPHYPHREFVQSWQQEGFGIGVLTYTKDAQPFPVS
jgi:predicted O-methyltransferase YrrM